MDPRRSSSITPPSPVPAVPAGPTIVIRPLREEDLPVADRIFRLAFGTYLKLPDPTQFESTRDFTLSRWHSDPDGAFAAEAGGELVGACFLSRRGSVAILGPIMVRPDFWNRHVAVQLLEAAIVLLPKWETQHAGLFTFADSAKHVGLYQRFGFWPRFLTAIMTKSVDKVASPKPGWRFSETASADRAEVLQAARELTYSICEGLDYEREIRLVAERQLGETVLSWDNHTLNGLAVCHCDKNTEAGEGSCYIKFGAVRPGPEAVKDFNRLLDSCDALAASKGLTRIEAGVNTARNEAYRLMLARGFQTQIQGVAMHRPNKPAYHGPGFFVMDDWR